MTSVKIPDGGSDRGAEGQPGYIIGSGWWSAEIGDKHINPKRKKLGDDSIRSVAFFDSWLASIERNCSPDRIVVVDSAAPAKPLPERSARVVWIELPFNARHSTDHVGRWSGWTRSVLVSGHYALASDADYFVYIEQDCLLLGEGIIEHCISRMRTGYMFGCGRGTPQPLQQSFFIIRRACLASFLFNLVSLTDPDSDLSPEWKFVYSSARPLVWLSNMGLLRRRSVKNFVLRVARKFLFDELPVDSGRVRPIPWDDPFAYFQHATADEMRKYAEMTAPSSSGDSHL